MVTKHLPGKPLVYDNKELEILNPDEQILIYKYTKHVPNIRTNATTVTVYFLHEMQEMRQLD